MRRRLAVATLVTVGVLPVLAGCARLEPTAYPDQVDLARAAAVWQDPWVAPSESDLAGPDSGGGVERGGGTRTTAYDGEPAAAVLAEVDLALAEGWRLHGVRCGDEATAYLTAGDPDDLDEVRSAWVDLADGAGDEVRVTAEVPHHRDGAWPDPGPPVAPADTCLVTGGSESTGDVPDLDGDPIEGDAAVGEDSPDRPAWGEDTTTEGTLALVQAVATDPWLAAQEDDRTSVDEPGEPDFRRDAPRFGDRPSATAPGRTPAARLATVADEVTAASEAWRPTWFSCAPGSGATAGATLVWTGEAGTAVMRLTAEPGSERVAYDVTTPVDGWEAGTAYADAELAGLPTVDVGGCSADGEGPVVAGVPAVLPGSVWPMLG